MVFKRAREKIFEEYIGNNKEKLFRISYVYLKNKEDAMDIIHESIVKAYNKLATIKDLENIDKWFVRLLINTTIDYIRKNSRIRNIKFKGISSEK